MTGPRRAVVLALAASTELQTSEQVVQSVASIDADVHRASVYRALEALVATELVVHVHLGHGATAYHLADPAGGGHLHVQCTTCGAVADVAGTMLDGVARRLRRQHGFELDAAHVALSGTCAQCSRKPADGDAVDGGAAGAGR